MTDIPSDVAGPRFARRAGIGFGLVTLITAVMAVATAVFAQDGAAKRERIVAAYADDLAQASRAQLAAERMVAIGRAYLLVGEPELLDRLNEAEAELDAALHGLERPAASEQERQLLADARDSAAHYQAIFDEDLTSSAESRADRLSLFRNQLLPRRRELGVRLEQLVEHKREVQVDARRVARRMAARTFTLSILLTGIGVAFSFVLAWRFIRHLAGIYRREQAAADQARRASAAREELLGIVAHDLRNPLNAISMKALTIERHEDNPRTRERAESIRRLAARMEELIRSLLEAASIEAGRLALGWKRCPVSELFSTVTETFGPIVSAKNVSLEHRSVPSDLTFWGDPDRISQVLSNLVGNAVKFTPDGGAVHMRAVESGFHVRFEVRDTGPGIAVDQLRHVFDRFWRGEDARRGTGLGLYIAKGIVEAHGGRIWADSRIGCGSAFIFELPGAPTGG